GELNKTYVPYGKDGAVAQSRQEAQDANAATPGAAAAGAAVQRCVSKANGAYQNGTWDLVDALNSDKTKLEEIDAKDLPENMRGMSVEQRKQYVQQQAQCRSDLQQKINQLNAEREKYVAEQQKAQSMQPETLDSAVVKTVREQMKEKGFEQE